MLKTKIFSSLTVNNQLYTHYTIIYEEYIHTLQYIYVLDLCTRSILYQLCKYNISTYITYQFIK